MQRYSKQWLILLLVCIFTFGILGFYGKEIYRQSPPVPQKVVAQDDSVIFTKESILDGQVAWQSVGGMQLGTVWGHGSYQAPDWSADWLHRELVAWLDLAAQKEFNATFEKLDALQQASLKVKLKAEYRKNQMDEQGRVKVSDLRAQAIKQTAAYYDKLFSDDKAYQKTRQNYAMKENTMPDAQHRANMAGFFFWTAWASATERPVALGGKAVNPATYTNNWPHEPLIDNNPTPENFLWSVISVAIMMAGIGFLVWFWSFSQKQENAGVQLPKADPLLGIALTASQRALAKYVFLVVALLIFQVFIGAFTAHYTVEGQTFYGIDVSQWFPYSLTRTWHIQSALFWIASGFLAAGLFLVPYINGGKDPKYQTLGVNVLFVALFIVVAGSFAGNYLAIANKMPLDINFWLGHQGYEYVELGRLWQIALFIGLVLWLILMLRGVLPALRAKNGADKNLLTLFTFSITAIGLFYASGFFYGERTNLSVMEYWRWWIVHLWVEGFFEVFATTALAFIFATLGLVSLRTATVASLMSASIFLLGGVPGTFHHLYFSGTTTPVMAVGAAFSALEVVPLILMGHEAWEHYKMHRITSWMSQLKWPVMCFVAVAFWNMLGAGVLGFFINPPISLYYLQGLNMTPSHGHSALFGVYGFLSLGFILLVLRYLRPTWKFNEKWMKVGFWGLNAGLILMVFTSLVPIGLFQFHASLSEGLWYARSETFMQMPILQSLRWFRTFGDVVFLIGVLALSWQVIQGLRHKAT